MKRPVPNGFQFADLAADGRLRHAQGFRRLGKARYFAAATNDLIARSEGIFISVWSGLESCPILRISRGFARRHFDSAMVRYIRFLVRACRSGPGAAAGMTASENARFCRTSAVHPARRTRKTFQRTVAGGRYAVPPGACWNRNFFHTEIF